MNNEEEILYSYNKLKEYVKNKNFSGYDPYDALNSQKLSSLKNKYLKVLITQFFVYSPLNLRPFFNIKKERNPKAIGLFLSSYCNLLKNKQITKEEFKKTTQELVEYLLNHNTEGYTGYCWGFNFNWQDINRYAKKGMPTIVISSYIGNAFLDLYEITKQNKYLEIAKSISTFILTDLNITKTKDGICFSYTPIDHQLVHNANCLGAAFLSRIYYYTQNKELLEYAINAFNFTLSHQKKDGSWSYSINPTNEKTRDQIDFHQGFILDSLIDFITYTNQRKKQYLDPLFKGCNFYMNNQFDKHGKSKWRLPLKYPIDTHHQAQGIITFSKMYNFTKEKQYLNFAQKIAYWTINHMQDETGYFYYQKWPFITNKISYMRWSQAWMIYSMTFLFNIYKKKEGNIE